MRTTHGPHCLWRRPVALGLCEVLLLLPLSASPQTPSTSVQKEPLRSYMQKSLGFIVKGQLPFHIFES